MDKKEFGRKVRNLREEKGITREDLCGDEADLSVRQLARIETGKSLPTLKTTTYIARSLGVSIGHLTDNEGLDLPFRYRELKYKILRTPTYLDEVRLNERESQFEEIFTYFYEELPEEEQLIVDCEQASMEVMLSDSEHFGTGILEEYFEQLTYKEHLSENDLILLELYFMCLIVSNFSEELYDPEVYNHLLDNLLEQEKYGDIDNLFLVNRALIKAFNACIRLGQYEKLESIAKASRSIMTSTGDFQKMPLLNLIEWKYYLFTRKDRQAAKECFENAVKFSQVIKDEYLEENLKLEWEKDTKEYG